MDLIESLKRFAAQEAQLTDAQRAERRQRERLDDERRTRFHARFDPLAIYNTECNRGLVHTAEYDTAMVQLQREFDEQSDR
jgi:hypothetical protein